MCFYCAHHSLAPPIIPDALRYFCPLTIVAIKRNRKILEILLAFCCSSFAYFIEYSHWNTVGIIFGLYHYWRNGTYKYSFSYTSLPMLCNIPNHFTTTGGVTDVYRIF